MYAWLWRHLPGPVLARVVLCLFLALAVVTLLFLAVFPWISAHLQVDHATVGASVALHVG